MYSQTCGTLTLFRFPIVPYHLSSNKKSVISPTVLGNVLQSGSHLCEGLPKLY